MIGSDPSQMAHLPNPDRRRAARHVYRAMAELRRGTPVLITGAASWAVLAAETAGAEGLSDLAAVGTGTPLLVLGEARAEILRGRAVAGQVALRLAPDALAPSRLNALADPTAEQMLPPLSDWAAPPAEAPVAMLLAKLARLLPAVIMMPASGQAGGLADDRSILQVAARDIAHQPRNAAATLTRVAEAAVPLHGAETARLVAFRAEDAGVEHVAVLVGDPARHEAPLVRLHSECFTGDLLGSLRCDCGPQLRGAIQRMTEAGGGALLYLAQEGRGIGLVNKLRAYALQDGLTTAGRLDTAEANHALGWGADERSFDIAASMLRQLGLIRIRLLTNNPDKVAALQECGIDVAAREPLRIAPNGVNDDYLATKAERFGHLLG